MSEEKTVVVLENFQVPALSGNLGQAFNEEMDGLPVEFDRVKIPSGGGLAFELPGEDEDEVETEKRIVGVIVDHHPANAYWEERYSGANNPPNCSSMDGKIGIDKNGNIRNCVDCPMNQWGTDTRPDGTPGRGKACKNMHRIYILREGEMFPLLLTLPPTSLKNFGNFIAKRVLGKGLRTWQILTEVSLKKATSGDGIAYSQAKFKVAGILPKEKTEQAQKYSEGIKAFTRKLEIGAEDYETDNANYVNYDEDVM